MSAGNQECPLARRLRSRRIAMADGVTMYDDTLCGAAADAITDLRTLLADGLDLCVRARTMDGHDANLPLWVQDQYAKELAEWERRSRARLTAPPLSD